MSVARALGIESDESPAMQEACCRWRVWQRQEPALVPVESLEGWHRWARKALPTDSNSALRALVKIGSPQGGDDPAAITALTWALLPGAVTVARRLAAASPEVDALVASHLWRLCREFPWWRGTKVAIGIVMQTRHDVMQDLGILSESKAGDRAWARTVLVEPADLSIVGGSMLDDEESPCGDLLHLLDEAIAEGVISHADRRLLIDAANRCENIQCRNGRYGGLTARSVTRAIGEDLHVSSTVVARRITHALDALHEKVRRDLDDTEPAALALGA